MHLFLYPFILSAFSRVHVIENYFFGVLFLHLTTYRLLQMNRPQVQWLLQARYNETATVYNHLGQKSRPYFMQAHRCKCMASYLWVWNWACLTCILALLGSNKSQYSRVIELLLLCKCLFFSNYLRKLSLNCSTISISISQRLLLSYVPSLQGEFNGTNGHSYITMLLGNAPWSVFRIQWTHCLTAKVWCIIVETN